VSGGRISVVVPVRGDGIFLRAALMSVAQQAIPVAELLVVDDGMTDAARDVLNGVSPSFAGIRVLEGPKQGPAAARNRAIGQAAGDLIAFIDDDDLWPADKLLHQMRQLERQPDLQAIGGRVRWFHRWNEIDHRPLASAEDQELLHVNLGAFLFRCSIFERIGLLDESHLFAEDVDFILRIIDGGQPFALLNRVTLDYRRHGASMTGARSQREQSDFKRALFRSANRRRRMPGGAPSQSLESYVIDPA